MPHRPTLQRLALILGLATLPLATQAAEPLKIGLVLPMSGPFAAYGKQIENGARLYLSQTGYTMAGRRVELVVRDDTGVSADLTKQLAGELVHKDRVELLAGFAMTPGAQAATAVATETRTPMVIMNAATSSITSQSPYVLRTSMTLAQVTAPIATWAARGNIRKVYTVVADYGPGIDAETQFKATFSAAGGQIVGGSRVPLKGADFNAELDRIARLHPEAVFVFLPPGQLTLDFMKGFNGRGLMRDGVRLIATGNQTDEDVIEAMGDEVMGLITSFHYAESHDSPENQAYTGAYYRAYPKDRPNFMSVGGYDGMALIARALDKTGGSTDAEKFVEAARTQRWTSPRGPVAMDPTTRDIVQNVYIRGVARVKGKLQNIEFDQVADVRDPGKP